MTDRFAGLPLDHPYLERIEAAHQMDRNTETSIMAAGIVHDAVASGHPDDKSSAARVMAGASGAAHVQAVMQPYVDKAAEHDVAADELSVEAIQWAQEAQEDVQRCLNLPNESVPLADGSSVTRGQALDRHDKFATAAAQREGRGDFEHTLVGPGRAVSLLVAGVLAAIEAFLLIWPVTNATWTSVASVGYVAGLLTVFLIVNEELPKKTGRAIRAARETVRAAWENTSVGLSAARAGDAAGRDVTGHVDQREVSAAERKKIWWCILLGAVLAAYSAVMFVRVYRLAAGLGLPLTFVVLAAALIAAFTAGIVVITTQWWSAGNALGDHIREHGAIVDQSRVIAEGLAWQFCDHARSSGDAAELARQQLNRGDQVLQKGYQTAGLGLQKAAKILDQETVPMPRPDNLLPAARPIQTRTLDNLSRASRIVAQAQRSLDTGVPFRPSGPAPNPWEFRSRQRQAPANPAFVDPAHLGALHAPPARNVQAVRKARLRALGLAVLTALAALMAIGVFVHG